MTTTALVVELVVVGIGTLSCVLGAVIAFFGYAWIPGDEVGSAVTMLLLLSTAYVLGIVMDRLTDTLVASWADKLRVKEFGGDEAAYNGARNLVYIHDPFRNLAEYNRSRVRVARGWAGNAVLAIPALNGVVWAQLPNETPRGLISAVGSILLLLLGGACGFAWFRMTSDAYKKVKEQALFLSSREAVTVDDPRRGVS